MRKAVYSSPSVCDLKKSVTHLAEVPGVYRMCDSADKVLYVGKAKNIRKRVTSYFSGTLSAKNKALLKQTSRIDVTVTKNETEALLLENNQIKEYQPRYNILLRDDKSYPYIHFSDGEFPRMLFYRGRRKRPGKYFGPYPNVRAVRTSMNLIYKTFLLRQCPDSVFRHRSRPCLQYQIKRCSAPCVNYISREDYADAVRLAGDVLSGRSETVIEQLAERMERAAQSHEYEKAAMYRDRIETLRNLLHSQHVSNDKGEIDVIACHTQKRLACVQVFKIRGGLNVGNNAFFPVLPESNIENGRVLETFIGQYYLNNAVPEQIIVSERPANSDLIQKMLSTQSGRKVTLHHSVRGHRKQWLESAKRNAENSMNLKMLSEADSNRCLTALQKLLDLPEPPKRMECFDISHTMGDETVASCVVFEEAQAVKQAYRRFNIEGITGGDDYAAMHRAVQRRYLRTTKEKGVLPDVLFIDGGKGQLNEARKVMRELGINQIRLVGISKGKERRPGDETLIVEKGQYSEEIRPADQDRYAMHLIRQIRDEAHRFAISGHRLRRGKKKRQSVLESIPGLGPQRRRNLLKHFGGLHGVRNADVEELARVRGISVAHAQVIYETLREYPHEYQENNS